MCENLAQFIPACVVYILSSVLLSHKYFVRVKSLILYDNVKKDGVTGGICAGKTLLYFPSSLRKWWS